MTLDPQLCLDRCEVFMTHHLLCHRNGTMDRNGIDLSI